VGKKFDTRGQGAKLLNMSGPTINTPAKDPFEFQFQGHLACTPIRSYAQTN